MTSQKRGDDSRTHCPPFYRFDFRSVYAIVHMHSTMSAPKENSSKRVRYEMFVDKRNDDEMCHNNAFYYSDANVNMCKAATKRQAPILKQCDRVRRVIEAACGDAATLEVLLEREATVFDVDNDDTKQSVSVRLTDPAFEDLLCDIVLHLYKQGMARDVSDDLLEEKAISCSECIRILVVHSVNVNKGLQKPPLLTACMLRQLTQGDLS